ncbi:NIPSNAP family protein [Tropicimonas marinistellae]|uniref:NIPSNAP family protein n=1 Tax=Tropicimonas marinistellae TaxID=1739787 RepID=UPI0008349E42|nr:NIPSNAP family protein [Tropicimonas marinistellae]
MLLELRTYDFAPGVAHQYLELLAHDGIHLITRHLPLAGYWITEVGQLNRLHHLWAYADIADRLRRRDKLMSDRDWTEGFVPRAMPMIGNQQSRFFEVVSASDATTSTLEQAGKHGAIFNSDDTLMTGEFQVLSMGYLPDVEYARTLAGRCLLGPHAGEQISFHTLRGLPQAPVERGATELLRRLSFSPL